MSTLLIIADHRHGALAAAARKAARCAADFGVDALDILVLAEDGAAIAAQAAGISAIPTVKHIDHAANAQPLAATAAPQIVAAVEAGGYSRVLGSNTPASART